MSDPSGQQAAWELTKSLERKLGRPLNTTEQQVLGYFGMDHVYKPRASGAGRGNWISLSAHPLRDLHPALEFAAAELSPVEAEIAVRLAAFIAKDSVGGHVKQARRELAVGFGGKPANSWLQGTGGWLLQVLLQCSLAHEDFWPLAAVPVALGCAWLQ